MLPHAEAQELLVKALRHLGRKLDLEEECIDCGCSPITASELALLFKYLPSEGVDGVASSEPVAPAKPNFAPAFPAKSA